MKKLSVAVLLTGLLSVGVVAPAQAAEPTDPAPTNVQISWKDDTYKFVHVTWTEPAGVPNRVFVRKPGSTTAHSAMKFVAADAPNEFDLPKDSVWQAGIDLQVGVSVGDAAGETSPVALSVAFDTIPHGDPVIVSYQPSGTGTLQVTWKPGTPIWKDTTPGDPLDVDLPASYQPGYRGVNGVPIPVGQPTASTTTTFSGPKPPYEFVVTALSEWSGASSEAVYASPINFTASIPSWATVGANTVIRGTYAGPETATVTLQARNTPTSAWYGVVGYVFTNNVYEFTLPSVGTRQYRIAVSNSKDPDRKIGFFGGYSAPVTTTVQQSTSMTVYNYGVVRNYPASGLLRVKPAVSGTVALQRWNGTTWLSVRNTPLKGGYADFEMSTPNVGTYTYRYYVPAHTNNGLPVAAVYSTTFTIKVFP
jgi:hypothetical protein